MTTRRTPTVDINGKQTHVHRRDNTGTVTFRSRVPRIPPLPAFVPFFSDLDDRAMSFLDRLYPMTTDDYLEGLFDTKAALQDAARIAASSAQRKSFSIKKGSK